MKRDGGQCPPPRFMIQCLSIASDARLPAIGYRLPAIGHRPSAIGHRLSAIGYRLFSHQHIRREPLREVVHRDIDHPDPVELPACHPLIDPRPRVDGALHLNKVLEELLALDLRRLIHVVEGVVLIPVEVRNPWLNLFEPGRTGEGSGDCLLYTSPSPRD